MANRLSSATGAASTSSLPTLTAAMTLVAVHAVVHVALDALVVRIRLRFRMAVRALENRVVIRVRVARRTDSIRVAVVDRELRVLGVIEGRVQPARRAVTVRTRHREELRLRCVPRIRRVVVVGLVATDARRRQRGVVAVDVAVDARPRRNHVRSGQRERGVVVIEGRIRPLNRVMAEFASGWKPGVRHGSGRILEVGLVARNAQRAVQVVVVVDMTVRAGARRNHMRTGQWESGLRVIELAIGPLDGVVALLASGREPGVRYGSGRILEIGLMARNASSDGDVVVVVDMAVGADPRRNHMGIGQRPARLRVIELAVRPNDGVMALLASRREPGVRHGTLGVVVIVLMARNAGSDGDVVVIVDVAIGAGARRNHMGIGQRPSGLRVIELAIRPEGRVMALLAGGRKAGVRHRSLRVVVISLVARDAGRDGDVVVVVDMAIGASPRRNRMGIG